MNKIKVLISSLFKSITRDSFMLFILTIPIFVAILFRFTVPVLQRYLLQYFDLSEYYDFISIFLLVMGPMLSGMVIGFNLLDDRDENILTYMAITPIRKEGYLLFKIFAPMIAVFIQSFLILLIFNIGDINVIKVIPVILLSSLETPMYALIMASFASNKVEGLALGKLMGISMIGPFISYFLPSAWRYFAGILPTFWICETYFSSGILYWIFVLIGLAFHLTILMCTFRLFMKRNN